jgi:hypothetical protein
MTDDAPMMGSGDDLPFAVGRYHQLPSTSRLPIASGGWTKPGKTYLVGLFESLEGPLVCGGPFGTEAEVERALQEAPLQSQNRSGDREGRRKKGRIPTTTEKERGAWTD